MKARNKFYRIEEFSTVGWELIDKGDRQLSKQRASERLEYWIAEGVSPDRLRAVHDEDGKYNAQGTANF